MILSGVAIKEMVRNHRIQISPFDPEKITTNSYDLSLGSQLLKYKNDEIDPSIEQEFEIVEMSKDGLLLSKGEFLLGHSNEVIGSKEFVPIIHAKSSIARLGLFIHVTADLIDLGSFGQVTFQLYATLPILIKPNMDIAQVTFWKTDGEVILYDGKYQRSKGPKASQSYKDFKDQ